MDTRLYFVLCVIVLTNSYSLSEGKDSIDEDGGVEQCRRIYLNESLLYHHASDIVYASERRTRSERTEDIEQFNLRLYMYILLCPFVIIWTLCHSLALKMHLDSNKFKTRNKPSFEDLVNDGPLPTISSNNSCDEIAHKKFVKSILEWHNYMLVKSILEWHNYIQSPENDENNVALPASSRLSQDRSDDSPKADENEVSTRKNMIEDIQELKERRGCKICLNARMNIIFLPCNHMVACEKCSMFVDSCPVCRCRVKGTLQVQNSI